MLKEICSIFTLVVLSAGAGVFVNWLNDKVSARPIVEIDEGPHLYIKKEL